MRLLGVEPGWLAAAVVAVAVLVWAAIGRYGALRLLHSPAAWAGGALAVVSLGTVLAALPGPGRPLYEGPAAVLGPERARMAVELESAEISSVAVYTHLSNGLGLAAGTEVATVALLDREGRALADRPLRAGIDTGEWAVRRPDVAALPGIEAPSPWAVWIEGGGGPRGSPERPFFGQYYRASLELEQPAVVLPSAAASDRRSANGEDEDGTDAASPRVVVERASDLPEEVLLTVHRIEVAR